MEEITPEIFHKLIERMRSSKEFSQKILLKIIERMDDMLFHCKRVRIIRFDVRYPAAYKASGSNEQIGKLMRNARSRMEAKGILFHYVVTREQGESANPHYHVLALLDYKKKRNSFSLCKDIEADWLKILDWLKQNCIHRCKANPSLLIRPSTLEDLEGSGLMWYYLKVLKYAAYIAKIESKSNRPKYIRDYLCSPLFKRHTMSNPRIQSVLEKNSWLSGVLPTLKYRPEYFPLSRVKPVKATPRKPHRRD
ncbi:hypothetical protein [Rhodospirillum sp. A1_3_36]|uniref:hypothetical protein n=1 Tax=Rhodospirillum sp. A1_3_36 TaxID=3391666 RepID=UPI0039A61B4E